LINDEKEGTNCALFFLYICLNIGKMINSVRNTVLSILNKNNYGYISPSDFNLYAYQAQMEMYEEYYSNYNKTVNAENMRSSGTDYADISKPIGETMESFLVSDFLVPQFTSNLAPTNSYFYPSLVTVGNTAYMISKIKVYTKKKVSGSTNGMMFASLIDSSKNFISLGVSVYDIVLNVTTKKSTFVTAVDVTTLTLADNTFPTIGDDYIIYSYKDYSEAEKVSNSKIDMLNSSMLTAPSLIYPAYTIVGELINMYPLTTWSYGAVKADYFRHPKAPKWTYITLGGGEPIFDQSQPDYQDFELPLEDEFKLVMKICQYCGISIRENEVTQFGMAQEQHEQPTFSMQQ
jgi:hypothetical protein